MKEKSLRLKCAARAVLFVLLLTVVGLNKSSAHDFEVDNLLYSILSTNPPTVSLDGHIDGTAASDELLIPETVEYDNVMYTVVAIGDHAFAEYTDMYGDIEIPNTVVTIGNHAFDNAGFDGSLMIGESVTSIGNCAFANLLNTGGDLTIPNSVTHIGDSAFYQSYFDGTLTLSNHIVSIGAYAFYHGDGSLNNSNPLTVSQLNLPSTLTSIGAYAFYNCWNMTGRLTLSTALTSIGAYAFCHCGFTQLNFGSTTGSHLQTIGDYAFCYCLNLAGNLNFPTSMLNVGSRAFGMCGFNGTLNLRNVQTIGEYAFSGCKFYQNGSNKHFTIPNSVTKIGNGAFNGAFSAGADLAINAALDTIPNSAFANNHFVGSLTIPSSVVSIGSGAFEDNNFTGDLTIHENMGAIGYMAFNRCSELTNVYYNAINCTISGNGNYYGWLTNCSSLSALYLGENVQSISAHAFEINLSSITVFAQTPPVLGESVFANTITTPIYVPCDYEEAYTSINWGGFSNILGLCSGTVTVMANPVGAGSLTGAGYYEAGINCTVTATANEGYTFANWTQNGMIVSRDAEYTFPIAGDMTMVANFVQEGNIVFADANVKSVCVEHWDTNSDGELSYVEAAAVSSLSSYFRYNQEITSFDELQFFIGLSLIESYSFYNCRNLSRITLPNTIVTVGDHSFYDCYSLNSILFSGSLSVIGESAFGYCSDLSSITILAETPPILGEEVFDNVNQQIPVYVPCDAVEDYESVSWGSFTNFNGLCGGTVTVAANPVEGGVVSGGGTFEAGETCTVTAIANTGYTFVNWTKNGVIASKNAEYTFHVASIVNMVANFVTEGNITFADANVKSICVENWDTNSDGELSYIEAAAVTSLSDVFRYNEDITSFDELQYFIGLSTIDYDAFYQCWNLTSIVLPNTVNVIGYEAFYGCNLGELILPSSVKNIRESAFRYCRLSSITVLTDTPPALGENAFYDVDQQIPVYVLCDAVEDYESVSWGDFTNFNGLCGGTVTVSANPTEGGAVTGGGNYGPDQSCTVTAVANPGYLFANWTKNGIVASNNAIYTFFFAGEVSLVANFVLDGNITFADANVKSICVEHWDTNGDDELSYIEAAAVTSLVNWEIEEGFFQNNSEITSFDELQYFIGLSSIDREAFKNCSNLTSIVLPNSVTVIDYEAFRNCSNLTSIVFPNSVTVIDHEAFRNCGLTSIVLPSALTTLKYAAFQDCSNLSGELIVPNTVTTIEREVFRGCSGLTGELTIPAGVTTIGYGAFQNTGFTVLNYNAVNCSISIDYDHWLQDCNNLTTLNIGEGVQTIPNNAFFINWYVGNGGFIGDLTIPSSVTSIGAWAFYNNSFTALNVLASVPPTVGENVFGVMNEYYQEEPLNIPVYVPCDAVEEYESVSWGGFTNFNGLCGGTVTVAANPTECGTVTGGGTYGANQYCSVTATANPGYAFVNWTKNGTVVSQDAEYSFPVAGDVDLVANFMTGGNITFADANVKDICVVNWDTNNDGELSYFEASEVTSLSNGGNYSVFRNNLEITSFDELQYFIGLSLIEVQAFRNCGNLTSIVLPNSITVISQEAFSDCGLTSIVLPNALTTLEAGAFVDCGNLSGELIIPNSVTTIEDYAFRNCSALSGNLILPSSLTTLGSEAFKNCSGFTGELVIPNSITTIQWETFSNCTGFNGNLIIGESIETINSSAFYNCSNLQSITILASEVPQLGSDDPFENVNKDIPVYVSCDSFYEYVDSDWGGFSNFQCAGCPIPYNLMVNNITYTTADFTWTGNSDSYTVQKRTATDQEVLFFDDFEESLSTQGWTIYTEGEHMEGYNGWVHFSGDKHSGSCSVASFSYYDKAYDADNWLVTPQLDLQGTLKFWNKNYDSSYPDEFEVLLSTSSNAISDFTTVLRTMQIGDDDWTEIVIDLSGYEGQKGYIAIHHVSYDKYYIMIDDFGIYGTSIPAGEWETVTTTATAGAYTLTGLTPNTKYDVRVKGNCEDAQYSNPYTFTTLNACPAPTNLEANNVTHTTVDFTWTGSSDSYTVQKRAARYQNIVFFDGFEESLSTQGWTIYTEGEHREGYNGWVRHGDDEHSGSYSVAAFSYYDNKAYNADNWLVSPQLDLQGTLKFWNKNYDSSYPDEFEVLLSTSSNAISDFTTVLRPMQAGDADWAEIVIDLSSYEGQKGYIAIHHVSYDKYYIMIDDFGIYGTSIPAGEWETVTTTATAGAYTLTGLTANTKYDVRVKGNCDGAVYSSPCAFTTLDESTKIFIKSGNWDVASNWLGGIPTIADDAIIQANVTIPTGSVATAKTVTVEGTPTPTITIKDGGQLVHNNDSVVVTMEKEITGYTDTKDNYYLLSVPTNCYNGVDPSTVPGMLDDNYDLYSFNYSYEGQEWRNYKYSPFYLYAWNAYLYASNTTKTLAFTGEVYASHDNYWYMGLSYSNDDSYPFDGWNLIGNLYACNAYMVKGNQTDETAFYRIEGDEVVASTGEIAPLEGVFIKANTEDARIFWNRTAPAKSGMLSMTVNQSNNRGNDNYDRAMVRFGNGEGLEKFQLNPNHTKVYIPQDGKDYAVVSAESYGELPVNFKAAENGNYTLSFTTEDVEFSYLHLIDNMTGNDVDLLQTPSYSFDARTIDYASRFKLVFAKGSADKGNDFGFFDANGNLMILGIEGTATLQVIDVTGRMISSETFSGNYSKAINAKAGVYMLRLIQGNNVRTQKIVVR